MKNNKTIIFVADVFVDAIPQGGAEIVNDLLAKSLRKKGFEVIEVESCRINSAFIDTYKNCLFIIAGVMTMPPTPEIIKSLLNVKYVIYEHDHKYVNDRNPAKFADFRAPENQLRFVKIYENAEAVICQSSMHQKILSLNLPNCKKVISAAGSIWSEEFINFVENSLKDSVTKNNKAAIIESSNEIKGQTEAEEYCKKNNIEYDLVSAPNPKSLYNILRKYEYFVFFPKTPETFSRIFMEAKLAQCKIITNSLVGAVNEKYTYSDPKILVDELRETKSQITNMFENFVPRHVEPAQTKVLTKKPNVSIITSVFRGEKFIDGFMEDITRQSYFQKCELIMVDCNEGKSTYEKDVIQSYQKKYPNIHYHCLQKDPGVYGGLELCYKS